MLRTIIDHMDMIIMAQLTSMNTKIATLDLQPSTPKALPHRPTTTTAHSATLVIAAAHRRIYTGLLRDP